MQYRILKYVTAIAIAAIVLIHTTNFLKAQEKPAELGTCPTDKPCKVITLTMEQADTLDQIITNTAIQGPYAQIAQVVQFYKEMLASAPAGKPGKAEKPAEPPKK